MSSVSVRRLEEQDRDVYFSMVDSFYSTDAVMAKIPKKNMEATFAELMMSDRYAACLVAEYEGKIVGYILIARTFSQEAGGECVWFEEIYTLPEMRGKGIATALMKEAKRLYPASRYRLEVEPENEGAVRLYLKQGFDFLEYGQMYTK